MKRPNFFLMSKPDDSAGAAGGDAATNAAKTIAGATSTNPPSGDKRDAPAGGQGESKITPDGGAKEAAEDLNGLLSRELGLNPPEDTVDTVKAQLAASSKEAKRLKQLQDDLKKHLDTHGVEVAIDKEGKLLGLKAKPVRGEDGQFKAAPPPPDFSKLSGDEQDEFAANPAAAISKLWARAMKTAESHFVRVAPTVEAKREPPTQAEMDAAVAGVKALKGLDGKPVFENFDALKPSIDALAAKLPQELVDAYRAHPQVMLSLLASKAQDALTRLQAWSAGEAQRKAQAQEAARQAAGTLPSGEGTVALAGTSAARDAAKAIARAGG